MLPQRAGCYISCHIERGRSGCPPAAAVCENCDASAILFPRTKSKRALPVFFVQRNAFFVSNLPDESTPTKINPSRVDCFGSEISSVEINPSMRRARAVFGQRACQCPGFPNSVFLQIFPRAKIRAQLLTTAIIPESQIRRVRTPRFHVQFVDAVIADERIGHRDDLAFIGRVGEDFLIAGHGSVEADFAARGRARAKTNAMKTEPSSSARIASSKFGEK